MNDQSTVFIVDDSREVRLGLSRLLTALGYGVRAFESAESFLAEHNAETTGCLLLDIRMPGMGGLELQRLLLGSRCARPIVFLTGAGDIQTSVQAMKAGAVDFLTKPIDHERLIAAVEHALQRDTEQRQEREICTMVQRLFESLTPREQQVMERVIRGQLNKQIAADLRVGEKTVKVHGGRLMSKMGVRSVAELVQLATRVGVIFEPAMLIDTDLKSAASPRSRWPGADFTLAAKHTAIRLCETAG